MGFGIRMGAKGAQFKSFLVIASNPSTAVTATFGDITHSGTTDGNGNITFTIKKKGTYFISSATGVSTTCDINKSNRTFSVTCKWTSYISIVANPGETITASGPHFNYTGSTPDSGVCSITVFDSGTYSLTSTDGSSASGIQCTSNGETASSTCRWISYVTVQTNANCTATAVGPGTYSASSSDNGVATITIKKSGTYSISSTSGASGGSAGCTTNGENINKDAVLVGNPSPTVATWSSGKACCYWSWGFYASGMIVYRDNTYLHGETGYTLYLDANTTVTGITDGGLSSGSSYTYKFQQYYNINGRTFYSDQVNKSYTAESISGSKDFTETEDWTVIPGVRSIYVQAVGAGGSGGGGAHLPWADPSHRAASGGGGGGGNIKRQPISVIPGQLVSVGVGSRDTTVSVNGVTVSASKGDDGGGATCYSQSTNGGNGGAGGSGGGGGNTDTGNQQVAKASGGTNGGDGTKGTAGGWYNENVGSGGKGSRENCYINGTLFSTGGASGTACAYTTWHEDAIAGGANTGNGGGGGWGDYNNQSGGASGGTGFCLISW